MYPNLRAELARRGITLEKLAELLDKTISTISLKMRGESPFTLNEAVKIKHYLESIRPFEAEMTIEILFQEAS